VSDALHIVQEFFPKVTSVKDAKEPITVQVTKGDNNSAKVRDHKACAMAVACKRTEHADGVIVSVVTAYVIKGTTATRYHLPESVSREVVSFDRDAGFQPGEYTMTVPCPTRRLGAIIGGNTGRAANSERKIQRKHKTTGIRTVLGSKLQ
jgi:hypothetical protein